MSKFDRGLPMGRPFFRGRYLNFKVLSSIEIQVEQKEKYSVNSGRFELENLKQCTKSARKRGYYGKNGIYVSGAGRPVCGDGKDSMNRFL